MDRSEVHAFAWALLNAAKAFLSRDARGSICVKIGAGELESAITILLEGFVRTDTALPPTSVASLWSWVAGFVGSDSETELGHLASQIRVAPSTNSWESHEEVTARHFSDRTLHVV